METKEIQISCSQMAALKRIAMNVAPLVSKKARISEKIIALGKEIEDIQMQIDLQQAGIKGFTGGLSTEDLIVRTDKGYSFNPDVIKFNDTKRVYEYIDGTVVYDSEKECFTVVEKEDGDPAPTSAPANHNADPEPEKENDEKDLF